MRLGVMCSGNGSNFENIVRTCREDEVVGMIHNKEKCGASKRANKLGIPHTHVKSKNEELIVDVMKAWKVDLIVLAGWMRIITPKLINAFPDRIINVHPSLLPKYKGLHAVEQALDSGDTTTGCTVHYVTEELDSGAIICQEQVHIFPHDTVQSLTKVIQQREYEILPRAIEHVKQRLSIAIN
jgi:formyltetrahydrofolate-dependent phosphoribosylglycinamide formyltransferase